MKKAIATLVVVAALGGAAYGYYLYRTAVEPPTITTARVVRGDISDAVGATGTLQAVTTVQVGTQVSGTIAELYADFNSLVTKGQVLARLDPSLFETQIEQAKANFIRAQADLERLKVTLDDAQIKLQRARELAARQLIPQTELDAAEVAVRSTAAQIRSAEAQVTQAQASLNQNEVNLQHTVIRAPIDGLVISRNVDVGQTVAASMQAPTLFVLAADLTKMQVLANLDESDVGRIRPNQQVSFRVDAYPAEDFVGTVSQVRLQPQVVQNVVTYSTVIDVPNPQLKLKPGMTANVTIEIARRSDVLRVPNAALRFRPTNDMFAALGQSLPDPEARGETGPRSAMGGRGLGASQVPPREPGASGGDAPRTEPPAASGGSVANGSGEGPAVTVVGGAARQGRGGQAGVTERLQALPPDQRQAMLERLGARGVDPTSGPGTGDGARRRADPPLPDVRVSQPGATTFDSLFGPLPDVESAGRVWIYVDNELRPVRVRLGITDGQATELIAGELQEGIELVTNVVTGAEVARPTPQGGFPPFMGPGGNRGFGGGGRGR